MSSGRTVRFLFLCVAMIVTLLAGAPPVMAQGGEPPRIRASAQPNEVEVGEMFAVQLIALVGRREKQPVRPKLKLPPGLVLRAGPQVATRTEATLGSQPIVHSGIEATWHVEAARTGKFRIGPLTVEHDGRVFQSNLVDVKVVPRGSKPPQNPLDPFGLLPQLPFGRIPGINEDLLEPPTPPEPPSDPALAMNVAPDSSVFLRAIADKSQAVVGEQVTLSIYQYTRNGSAEAVEIHEPSTPDFFQRQLVQPGTEQEPRVAYVGGNPWKAELLRKIALFPLRSGRLEIGPMRGSFAGFGFMRGRGAAVASRQSNPLAISVSDAPTEGRPVGFRAGDVGRFSLTATVDPRSIEASGAVGVTVSVAGTGNLPLTLPVPARTGVEWLEPEVRERIEVQNDRVSGARTFRYVVRIQTPGQVDLGEIALPFYDPDRRAYEVAQAQLGKVMVTPSTAPATSAAPEPDPFGTVAGIRRSLGPAPLASVPLSDRASYWIFLAAAPSSVLLFGAGAFAKRKLTGRWRSARDSLARQISQALRQAKQECKNGKYVDAAAAIERALHASIESSTGLRSRGVLRERLAETLIELGVDAAAARTAVEVLDGCERVRFEPDADSQAVRALIDSCESISGKLSPKRARGE
ncbi:MAG: BatD family protein [Deltaproteobacteria bacterium]|nr:BatD family protein [Deltaproteobacteria bacterium]